MEKDLLNSQPQATENNNLVNLLPLNLFPSREKLVAAIKQTAETPKEEEALLIHKVFEVVGWLDKVAKMFEKPESEVQACLELVREGPLGEKYEKVEAILSRHTRAQTSILDTEVASLIKEGLRNITIADTLGLDQGSVGRSVRRLIRRGQI